LLPVPAPLTMSVGGRSWRAPSPVEVEAVVDKHRSDMRQSCLTRTNKDIPVALL
jgi:hypothetical protein